MNMNDIVGRDNLLLMTFDTLRYDVAQDAWCKRETPNLALRLPATGWQRRHSPGNFTFAAHAAFFAGFFPTPAQPGKHSRLFALQFPGSDTVTADTCVLDSDNLVTALAQKGYHTICIGGVGFFNKLSPLGNVFPSLFAESFWSPHLGVTHPESTANQVRLAVGRLKRVAPGRRVFLFVNLSALHQPNHFYLPGAAEDSIATHRAALRYIDRELPPLFDALQRRGTGFGILTSDHGTAYGEDGYYGHRLAHPVVWDVPYAEFTWEHRP
jgi:Sulfatase